VTLRETLQKAEFSELQDGRGKLLIFTEHRDSMEYLSRHLASWGFHTRNIHGGMNPHDRKHAQEVFRTEAQVCVATEAAGEGINLQFCHLMINYDLPWNSRPTGAAVGSHPPHRAGAGGVRLQLRRRAFFRGQARH